MGGLQRFNESLQLNTSDFELFKVIAMHPKLSIESAIQILEIVTDIARQNILFTRVSLNIMLTVLQRFKGNTEILDFSHQLVDHLLKAIYLQDEAKMKLY